MATGKYVIMENGIKQRQLFYLCYGKSRKRTDCDGKSCYAHNRVDNIIDIVIRHIFACMRSIPKDEVVNSGLTALKEEQESIYKTAQRDYAKASSDITQLKSEVLKSIRGESKFTSELLNELIAESEKKLAEITAVRDAAKQELDNCKHHILTMQTKYDEVISWTELYDVADFSAKKMIVSNQNKTA